MITLKDWMETVNYRVTEGDKWYSDVYGDSAYCLSAWNGVHGNGGWSLDIVFDTETQLVYQVGAHDYTNNRAYRMIHHDYKAAHGKDAKNNEYANQAWDDVDYTDLEVDEDWLDKATAIVAGVDYDDRIKVPVEFSDEELLKYMKLAHERDITFNQLIEEALRAAIDNFEKDPADFKKRYSQRESEPHGY